jgi:hypothetical protein
MNLQTVILMLQMALAILSQPAHTPAERLYRVSIAGQAIDLAEQALQTPPPGIYIGKYVYPVGTQFSVSDGTTSIQRYFNQDHLI